MVHAAVAHRKEQWRKGSKVGEEEGEYKIIGSLNRFSVKSYQSIKQSMLFDVGLVWFLMARFVSNLGGRGWRDFDESFFQPWR